MIKLHSLDIVWLGLGVRYWIQRVRTALYGHVTYWLPKLSPAAEVSSLPALNSWIRYSRKLSLSTRFIDYAGIKIPIHRVCKTISVWNVNQKNFGMKHMTMVVVINTSESWATFADRVKVRMQKAAVRLPLRCNQRITHLDEFARSYCVSILRCSHVYSKSNSEQLLPSHFLSNVTPFPGYEWDPRLYVT